MSRSQRYASTVLAGFALLLTGLVPAAIAQERSVNPGVNRTFEDPDVERYVSRFEQDGRTVYDKRYEMRSESSRLRI